MEHVEFNLNYELLAKLSPIGFDHWKQHDEAELLHIQRVFPLYERPPRTLAYYTAQQDSEGYIKFQGWRFMQIFGPVCILGGRHFSASIRFLVEHAELVSAKVGKRKRGRGSIVLRRLYDSRNDLKALAEQGDKKAIEQLAALRNVDKLRKRYNRARQEYLVAKEQLG